MSVKIFFSYSRVDTEFTRKLATDLRNAGADLWIDQLDIAPGTRWDTEIEKALKEAESVLVVLSPNAVVSDNIMDEISYALESHKRVIPVIIDQCEVPFRIKRLQYIDFTQNYDDGFTRLSAVLNLGKQAPKEAEPEINRPIPEPKIQTTQPEPPPSREKNIPSYDREPVTAETTLPPKKPVSKWIYFGVGALVLLVIIILSSRSGGSSSTSDTNKNDSVVDNAPIESTVNDPVADSLKADSLFTLASTEFSEKNYDKATELFEKSAELGNSNAMYKSGYMYEGYESASLANFDKTLFWWRKGVAANNLDAMYSYGLLLNGNNISDYYKVPEEMINRDSSMYYWNKVNDNTPGGVVRYKKTGP